MPAQSAGILMYRVVDGTIEVLLVHPGGPFWARKDLGAWSIPKGEFSPSEDPTDAALREFEEELGIRPEGTLMPLGEIQQKAGKRVIAFALEGDLDVEKIVSDTCEIEWPPRSGKRITIPEVDRAAWFSLDEAKEKILPAQAELLGHLAERTSLKYQGDEPIGR